MLTNTHMSGTIYTSLQADKHTHARDEIKKGGPPFSLLGKQTTLCPVPSDQGTRSSKTQAVLPP